tara:strand:+ start:3151 stop:4536 length:1386 start_codon:yes stop_codon:yes gene_type:complete
MPYKTFDLNNKHIKDCGGGGDCYFLSVAESLIQLKNYAINNDNFVKSQMNHYLERLKTYVGRNTRKELSDKLRRDVVGKLIEKYKRDNKAFLNPVDNSEQQFYRYLPDDFLDAANNIVNKMDVEYFKNNTTIKSSIENYFNNYFKHMVRPGTWATSLEVMGTILLLRHDYNIMVGVTAAGTSANDPNPSERNVYGSAIIRIYNTTGYGSNGMHYQMLPFTSYNGEIICTDYNNKNEYPDCSNKASSVSNTGATRPSPGVDNTTQNVMDQLIPDYIELIKKYTEKINVTSDDAEKKRLTSDIDLHLSYILHAATDDDYGMVSRNMKNKINGFINGYFDDAEKKNEFKRKSVTYSEKDAEIKKEFIKRLNEVNVSIKTKKPDKPKRKKGKSYCCNNPSKGGGLKIKILKKSNKTKKISRKWSKKYKNSINCSEPRGFSQRQFCLSKTKKIREKNKKKNKSSKK